MGANQFSSGDGPVSQALCREVRFCVNPFLDETPGGSNSWSAQPMGTGLCLYLALTVTVHGSVDPQTGFVINIVELDKLVRDTGVPLFEKTIRDYWSRSEHIPLAVLLRVLQDCVGRLENELPGHRVTQLELHLNPARTITFQTEKSMILFSEQFEFAAMHTLWNREFSEEKNFEIFGKCAHRAGHGHNYIAQVQVLIPHNELNSFETGTFERIVDEHFIEQVDHKNLNKDIAYFENHIPTVENISLFAFQQLYEHFDPATLYAVTIWETSRTASTYYNPEFAPFATK